MTTQTYVFDFRTSLPSGTPLGLRVMVTADNEVDARRLAEAGARPVYEKAEAGRRNGGGRMIKHEHNCEWVKPQGFEDDSWTTGCGGDFLFNAGGVEDNGYVYCPYCGGKIVVMDAEEA